MSQAEELYIEPNPTEEELAEEIRVTEMVYEAIEQAEEKAEEETKQTIIHKWFAEDSIVQKYVQYAYEIWWMDLVTILECENWTWDMYRQSSVVKNWKREESYWFCQIHRPSQPDIVDNPLFRSDYKWQLDRCKEIRDRELNDWRIRFYAQKRKIKWVLCPKYVESRFIIK